MAPSSAPWDFYSKDKELNPGLYYVMPTRVGDHMYFQGGMTKRVKIKPFYLEIVQMISGLYK